MQVSGKKGRRDNWGSKWDRRGKGEGDTNAHTHERGKNAQVQGFPTPFFWTSTGTQRPLSLWQLTILGKTMAFLSQASFFSYSSVGWVVWALKKFVRDTFYCLSYLVDYFVVSVHVFLFFFFFLTRRLSTWSNSRLRRWPGSEKSKNKIANN